MIYTIHVPTYYLYDLQYTCKCSIRNYILNIYVPIILCHNMYCILLNLRRHYIEEKGNENIYH